MYILIVQSDEAISSYDNKILTKFGDEFLVTVEPDGWVEATSTIWKKVDKIYGAKIFDTEESAAEFANRWKGHPWYCKPNGKYRTIKVEKQYKQVFDGYAPAI